MNDQASISNNIKKNPSKFFEVIRIMVSKPSGLIGLSIVCFHILLAIFSPLITPHDFKAINPSLMLLPPSSEYWFGTDHLGRDVFTRTILGGRVAILVTFFGSLIALTWGGLLGIFCGLVGGKIDDIVMRIVDAFLAIPWILAMLLIVEVRNRQRHQRLRPRHDLVQHRRRGARVVRHRRAGEPAPGHRAEPVPAQGRPHRDDRHELAEARLLRVEPDAVRSVPGDQLRHARHRLLRSVLLGSQRVAERPWAQVAGECDDGRVHVSVPGACGAGDDRPSPSGADHRSRSRPERGRSVLR